MPKLMKRTFGSWWGRKSHQQALMIADDVENKKMQNDLVSRDKKYKKFRAIKWVRENNRKASGWEMWVGSIKNL